MRNLLNWEYVLLQPRKKNKDSWLPITTRCCRYWQRSAFFIGLCFIVTSFFISATYAGTDESASKLIQYLAQEKVSLTLANNESNSFSQPDSKTNLQMRKKQNAAMLSLTQAKIANLESFLANHQKQRLKLNHILKKLKQSPLDKSDAIIAQEQIIKVTNLSDVNNKTIDLTKDNLILARQYKKTLLNKKNDLDLMQANDEEQKKLGQIRKRISKLEQARANLYEKNIVLQQNKSNGSFNNIFNYEAKLLLNNQNVILIQHRITELQLQMRLIKADYLLLRSHDVKTIQTVEEIYENIITQFEIIKQSLSDIVDLLKSERSILEDSNLKQQFLNLQKIATARLEEVTGLKRALEKDLKSRQQQLKEQLSIRQSLTEYHLDSWPLIFDQTVHIPVQVSNYLKNLVVRIKDNYAWQDTWPAVYFWLTIGLLFSATMVFSRLLLKVSQDKVRSRLSAQLYDGVLLLLYRNIRHLAVMTAIIVTCIFNHVPNANYQLLINMMFVWLAFRNLILIARLMLLERISDSSGKDVKLYYRLKWLFLAGGWSTALMILSHQLPLSLLLQDIFNRLFMLFLLAVSIVGWKSKDVIPYLLKPFMNTRKRYVRNAITLLVILTPITLFTTAVIGLVGYFNLGWSLSRYQVYLLFVITSYVLLRGLIFDALELLSEWMISSLRNGWLWIEVILKPLDQILRVILLASSVLTLFQLYGWSADSWVTTSLIELGKYPFVNISGVHITLISTMEFIGLFFVFLWAAKWTREFSYRWIYRKARDAGIRNSLSVFTQYAVILIGGFITLRVLGLDFSGLSMVLGGLAVGMGFGLRDFASNIIGGIMLLIERPVREGDLITLGEHEGRVAHIGIRSMRVSSWDNMEVLIPNAETFNKPFTNWTHQDSVVRTVVPVKVNRSDDPVMIQQLIQDVLAIIPEILIEPMPQVFLKQIDDALVEFEVRYFINVQLHTRSEIRSNVLFAIMAQFKAANVKPPIPPLSVEFKEGDSNHVFNKQSATERD